MKLPDTYFGKRIEGSYDRYLEESEKEPAKPPRTQNTSTSTDGVNLADYVYLPSHSLYVAKERTHQDKTWYDTHEALHQEGARMLTIKEFVDFLALLRTGNSLDGLEQRLPEDEVERIYKEITEVREPWRSEWLDADFKVVNDRLNINYNHRTVNGNLKPQNSEPLDDCVRENSYVDLIGSANGQGLPTSKSDKQEFYYWRPLEDNNSVAGFFAGSDRTCLGCDWDPQGSNSTLGVRVAREK